MGEQDEDQKQFFRDLGATAEQTVQEVRGFEESYYNLSQWVMTALPLLADFNKKLQIYAEENFSAAYKFARELGEAKDAQDFSRIYTVYVQNCLRSTVTQMVDFAETYTNLASVGSKRRAGLNRIATSYAVDYEKGYEMKGSSRAHQ